MPSLGLRTRHFGFRLPADGSAANDGRTQADEGEAHGAGDHCSGQSGEGARREHGEHRRRADEQQGKQHDQNQLVHTNLRGG